MVSINQSMNNNNNNNVSSRFPLVHILDFYSAWHEPQRARGIDGINRLETTGRAPRRSLIIDAR